jgi:hypothetical protein
MTPCESMGEDGLPGESSKLILFFDRLPQMSGAAQRAILQARWLTWPATMVKTGRAPTTQQARNKDATTAQHAAAAARRRQPKPEA